MIGWLISNYDKRPYLQARNMNLGELCSLLVSFSVVNMEHTNIHKDILFVINKNLDNLTNQQLVQLMSVAKYLNRFNRYEGIFINVDFYAKIHERLILTKSKLEDSHLRLITRILKNDGIITKSPFLI
jgi:hypothetical protein